MISDKNIQSNKKDKSTQKTKRKFKILSDRKMAENYMVRRQAKGTNRKLCMGVTMDKEFLNSYLDKHAA